MFFNGLHVALGVCGSVAAYRSADFLRHLQRLGAASVRPLLSQEAHQFVSPLVLASLSKYPCETALHALDAKGVPLHISLAQHCDAFIIYAATANSLAKLAHGLADDLVATTALCFHQKPVLVVPAMNVRMWEHPLTQANLNTLEALAHVQVVSPTEGLLACGEEGAGHLANNECILAALYRATHPQASALAGKRVLVSAGGTHAPIDVARRISNASSGKMGLALADEAYAMGAEVTLVTAEASHTPERRPYAIHYTPTVNGMQAKLSEVFPKHDVLLMNAAVSDFIPQAQVGKIKKQPQQQHYTLEMTLAPDILAGLAQHKQPHQRILGFAAETELKHLPPLLEKLTRKGADALAINDVSQHNQGFGAQQNAFTLLWPNGKTQRLPLAPKDALARQLLQHFWLGVF